MKLKRLLLSVCASVFGCCLSLAGLVGAMPAEAASGIEQTAVTGWIYERTDGKAYPASDAANAGNYRHVQLNVSYNAAPQFDGTQAYWGFSVKNHLDSQATIRFGFNMGGGVTVWMGGADSGYYLVDNADGGITRLQGSAAQNIKVPANFDGKVFWKPTEGYNFTGNNLETIKKNGYRVKGLQAGYDFRSAYTAKLEFGNLYAADFSVGESGEVKMSDFAYKGNLDVLDTGYPAWQNQGGAGGGLAAMTAGTTITQTDLYEYTSLTVSGATARFYVGDTFNFDGLNVVGIAADGKNYALPLPRCTVDASAVDMDAAGTYDVTVAYGTVTAVYPVEVKADTVTAIRAKNAKSAFYLGDPFVSTGLEVEAVWESGKETTLDVSDYIVDSSAVNTSAAGTYIVTVKYGADVFDTYEVTVSDDAVVSISASGAKNQFYTGQDFSDEGLVVTAEYQSSATGELQKNQYTVDFSAVDMTRAGTYQVIVEYSDEITDSYSITVSEDTIVSIEAAGANCKFIEGETFGSGLLTVNAVYASGKREALAENAYRVDSSEVNMTEAGEYTVTVFAGDLECEYKVNVYDDSWVFYNRLDDRKADGNTYHGAFLQTETAGEGTPLGEQRYLGIHVKNLLPYTDTRIRFGFTYHNGTETDMMWMFGSGTYYMVDSRGGITKDEITGQYLFPKANFEGWIFVDTADMYRKENYKGEALQGLIVGYDFRLSYMASLGYNAIGAADFTEDGGRITMSGFQTLAYFGNMDISAVEQMDINAKPTEEQYAAALACITFDKIPAELISEANITALELLTEPTKKQYTMDESTRDLTGGVAVATYVLGENTIRQRFNLSDSIFAVSGFTAGKQGEQTINFAYAGRTISFAITVQDADDLIPVAIAIKTMPAKLNYLLSEEADWTGGVVTITFASGKTEDVGFDDERLNIVGFSTLSARENMSVYVTIAEDTTISASFKVNVAKPAESGSSSEIQAQVGCGSNMNGAAMLAGALALAAAFVLKKRFGRG